MFTHVILTLRDFFSALILFPLPPLWLDVQGQRNSAHTLAIIASSISYYCSLSLHEIQLCKPKNKKGRQGFIPPSLVQATVEKDSIISACLFYGHICTIYHVIKPWLLPVRDLLVKKLVRQRKALLHKLMQIRNELSPPMLLRAVLISVLLQELLYCWSLGQWAAPRETRARLPSWFFFPCKVQYIYFTAWKRQK